MNKKNSNIDGFIPRRSSTAPHSLTDNTVARRSVSGGHTNGGSSTGFNAKGASRSDIDASLEGLGGVDQDAHRKLTRKQQKLMRKMSKKPASKKKKIIKIIAAILVLIILAIAGFLVYKIFSAGGKSLKGNMLGVLTTQKLKEDSNGRSNFLVLGTSEDDPGHDGADLTDSMLVVSIDQNKKDMYMFSIPRDLYVEYGKDCPSGNAGKINAYFSCSKSGTSSSDEQERLTKTQKFVGDIFGMDIQYGVHVNHTVIKDIVDAIGGIDVDIEGSNGAPGILDRNFDWKCNYTCYYAKYDNGVHHLDGEHALYLSMVRGDSAPTYGLDNSNFDREKNQQKIIIAIKKKATSSGTFTDITKVTKIIDAIGDNLRTNIEAGELRTIVNVLAGMKDDAIHRLDLYDSSNPLVKSANYGGASVVVPSAGIYEYGDIQAYINKNLSSSDVAKEAAPILVLNGTDTAGLATTKADELKAKGYTIYGTDNAPDGSYDSVEIYQIGSGNSGTAKALKNLYHVDIKTTQPPLAVNDSVKFVVVFGSSDK